VQQAIDRLIDSTQGGYTEDDLLRASKLANAHDFISAFEDGYKTRVGERGVRLSGGQKQRIAIARAMLRRPRLLFLDEATSSLDAESESVVQQAIDRLIDSTQGGCTVILIAHRLSTVINSHKIAVVDDGGIIEQGTHDELLALSPPGVYARLVEKQLARKRNVLEVDQATADKMRQQADIVDSLYDGPSSGE